MYCKYIKLASGDDIIAVTDDSCTTFKDKEFINITSPVKVGTISFPRNGMIMETLIFMPWVAVAAFDEMLLPTRNIVLAVDVDEAVYIQYNKYISKSKRVVFDKDTVPEMEAYVEDGFDPDEDDEEDEEYDDTDDRPNYH